MKNLRNLMGLVMAAIVVSLGFVSCNQEEDGLGAANAQDKKASLVITEKAVLRDTVWGKVIGDTLIVVHDSLKNDTVFKSEQESIGFSASIKRDYPERKTTVERLEKLDFTFEAPVNKQNGKMEFVGSQSGNDGDAQNYTLDFTSEKLTKWGLNNVHFEIVNTANNGVKNVDIEKKKSDSIRVKSTMDWNLTYKVVNVPNLDGQTFTSSINQTNHERYISYGDPVLVRRDTTMTPTYGIWSTEWELKVVETYRVNGQDSIAPAQVKKVTLVSTCGIDKLEDAFVGSLEFNHNFTSEKWSNWYDVESADKSVSVQERRFERLGTGSNGIAKDEFATRSFVTEQKATVVFSGLTWNIPATAATLTNVRHTFLEEASDLNGYSMLKFVDDEVASYAGASEGDNCKKLNSSCKLYLKLQTPDVDKIEFVGTKVHTEGMAKINGSITPVFTDGTKGGAIKFSWEKAESWTWKGDSVIAENVNFVNQNTGKLTLKGDVKESKKTFATDNDEVTIECTQFDADFELPVTVDGVKKMTTWHAMWFENFYVCYGGKKVALTKSSYSVKNQNDKLTKDEVKSSATSEIWGYSVEGSFSIDEDSRSAMGYGRLTKALEEVVVTEGWDKFNFETDAKEYTDRVEYFLKWIKEYSTGKKTQTDIKVILKRNSKGSYYDVTVENPERTIGSQSENSILTAKSEKVDDIVISYDWLTSTFELPNYFDGSIEKSDIATFVDPTNVRASKKNSKGEDVVIELPSFNHALTSTVSEPQVTSENDEKTVRTYERVWNWVSSQCTSVVKSIGEIITVKSTPVTPDFDIEVGSIYATVSRPSNRNASDITAYTYLLVSKDGKKCLPLGFYNGVITVDEKNGIVDYKAGMNSACYVKDENKVVATRAYSDSGLGMMIWCGADGNPVDAASHITLQGAGFNDRGNDWVNHTGKYAPRATKKGNVTVVTFEGTNVSYTFRGWNVQ